MQDSNITEETLIKDIILTPYTNGISEGKIFAFKWNCFCTVGSVFCVHADPKDSSLAVSGGEDDKAYVWKIIDGSQLIECTGLPFKETKLLSVLFCNSFVCVLVK